MSTRWWILDPSIQEMGSTLSLTLSEGNHESGHHYIILSGYKFKLEWEQQQISKGFSIIQYIFRLYLVTDETYPALSEDWGCEFDSRFGSGNTAIIIIMPW